MSSVQNPDADREDYVVSVVEFSGDPGAATATLQRVFGLDEAEARAILSDVPVAVRRGVNRIRAEYFRRALELSGARIEVRDGDGAVVSAATAPRAQLSGPLNTRAQPSGPLTARAQLSGPMAGVPRAISQPTAADRLSQSLAGKTLAFGTPAANDAATDRLSQSLAGKTLAFGATPAASDAAAESPGSWGDLQPLKPAPAKPHAPQHEPPVPDARPEPPATKEEAWAISLEAEPGPLDSPLTTARAEHALEMASLPSPARGPKKSREAAELNTLELEGASAPPGPALELDLGQPQAPERTPGARHAAIPAGEQRRAPGSDTIAKARRKQHSQSLESSLGETPPRDPISATRPRVAPRPASGDLQAKANAPAEQRRPVDPRSGTPATRGALGSRPMVRQRESGRLELGFWEATTLGFSGTSVSWIAKIAGASVLLAGLAQLSVRIPALGLPLFLVGLTCLLGLCSEYHRYVFWAAATRESALKERPALSVVMMMRDGVHIAAFALCGHVLLWLWLAGQLHAAHRPLAIVFSPTLWVLGFGPALYWPIALGCAAAKNRASGVWNIALGLRALGRAPVAIAVVVLTTAAAFMASLMISAAVVSSTSLDPTLALFTAAGLPIAISHALAAALMGRAVHQHPDLFE